MEAGELLGNRYRLVAPLGRGGTSVVWRARDEVLGRAVAVKLLASARAGDPALSRRLRAEAQAAARLHHPNVVMVYDFGQVRHPDRPPAPYVVLELVDGHALSDVLKRGRLPWRDAVRVCAQVAAALAAAHHCGLVHRDVKPNNVMLTGGRAKLVDFGISATIGETDAGPDGKLLGTPAYLAPERLETGPVRTACDVYGLGLLLYQALTGTLPWRGEGVTDLLAAHQHRPPAPLPALPGLPPEVAELCLRCLAKRPAERPSAAEAARVLVAAATIGRPAGPPRQVPRGGSGRRRALVLAGAGMLLIAVLTGSHPEHPHRPFPGLYAEAALACQVRYGVSQDSGTEFVAEVTVTNTGAAPVEDWELDFAFPADQRVVWSAPGEWEQSGRSVAVAGSGSHATLPAGRSLSLRLEGSYREENPLPTTFQLNGVDCVPMLVAAGAGPGGDLAADQPGGEAPEGGAVVDEPPDGPAEDSAGAADEATGPGPGDGRPPGDDHTRGDDQARGDDRVRGGDQARRDDQTRGGGPARDEDEPGPSQGGPPGLDGGDPPGLDDGGPPGGGPPGGAGDAPEPGTGDPDR